MSNEMPSADEFKPTRQQRAAEKVARAITNQGRSPAYHAQQLRRLREEWPALATALRDLVASQQGPGAVPKEWR